MGRERKHAARSRLRRTVISNDAWRSVLVRPLHRQADAKEPVPSSSSDAVRGFALSRETPH